MKKQLLSILFLLITMSTFSQVGINTESPAATLDVVGKPDDETSLDGLIPPRLTGNQLRAKTYTSLQDGAIVYITEASSILENQVVNVSSPGLYQFDKVTDTWIYSGSTSVMTNFKSEMPQALNTTTTNDQVISFSSSESSINTATTFNNNIFTVLYDGYYSISGFVGFNGFQNDLTSLQQFLAINLSIQLSINNGAFNSIAGVRAVYVGSQAGLGTVIQIPQTIIQLKKGDQLRMVIRRPDISTSGNDNSDLGTPTENNGHINIPTGTKFSKSFYLLKVK